MSRKRRQNNYFDCMFKSVHLSAFHMPEVGGGGGRTAQTL